MKFEKIQKRLSDTFGKKSIAFIALLLVAGLLLLFIPSSESKDSADPETDSVLTSAEYCALLEEKAVRLISEIPDVHHCKVFITLERGYRYVYATDQHVREDDNGKQIDKTIVLAGNGKGEEPIMIEETMPSVAGVAVVCEGASYETQYRIIELMCALFDIKSNRISVQT